jgi:hypothetical protein
MKFLFELAKIIAKKTANLGKRKKDDIGDPFIRRLGEEIDESDVSDVIRNIHNRTERIKVKSLGGNRRKGKERRKPPEYSGN